MNPTSTKVGIQVIRNPLHLKIEGKLNTDFLLRVVDLPDIATFDKHLTS